MNQYFQGNLLLLFFYYTQLYMNRWLLSFNSYPYGQWVSWCLGASTYSIIGDVKRDMMYSLEEDMTR